MLGCLRGWRVWGKVGGKRSRQGKQLITRKFEKVAEAGVAMHRAPARQAAAMGGGGRRVLAGEHSLTAGAQGGTMA